jgi:hypothetical protein
MAKRLGVTYDNYTLVMKYIVTVAAATVVHLPWSLDNDILYTTVRLGKVYSHHACHTL